MNRSERTFATAQTIRDLYALCMRGAGRSLADRGLSGQQAMVVRILAHAAVAGQELGVGDLCRELALTKGTVSGILTRMEEAGWIEKVRSERDGRAVVVRFSAKGRRLAAGSREALAEAFDRAFASFGDEELETAHRSLQAVLDRMKEAQEAAREERE